MEQIVRANPQSRLQLICSLQGTWPSRYKKRLIDFYPDDGVAYIDGLYWKCAMIGPKLPADLRGYKLTHVGYKIMGKVSEGGESEQSFSEWDGRVYFRRIR